MIRRIPSEGPYASRVGYCRAVVHDGLVHVSGTVGQGDGVVAQCRDALRIIGAALDEAGSGFDHALRVRYILQDADEFEPCWPLLSETFGANPPAATMIVAGLIDPKFRIEIELTAAVAP